MMDKKTKIRSLLAASLGLSLLSYACYDYPYNPKYEIVAEQNGPFGRYSNGDIYIGNNEYILSVINKARKNDILIVIGYEHDDELDPNASIISSYRITDKEERNEILTVLKKYDSMYNTEWDRTIESMRVEWTVHNMLYDLHYERARTKNVDLDNSEEELYSNPILQRLLK